jgi:hypothetical protein
MIYENMFVREGDIWNLLKIVSKDGICYLQDVLPQIAYYETLPYEFFQFSCFLHFRLTFCPQHIVFENIYLCSFLNIVVHSSHQQQMRSNSDFL